MRSRDSLYWIGLATVLMWSLAGCSSDTAGPNRAPVARAGVDRVIEEGRSINLDGSGSFDPDGDPLNYQWSLVSAPDGATATFDDSRLSSPSLTPDADGLWMISLVVSDTRLASEPDVMHVRVIPVGCTRDEDCDDGVDCTADGCNLATQTCVFTPDDGACADDGVYCNGTEVCDSESGCVGSGDPCEGSGQLCDETNDACVDCLDEGDCVDAISCTVDSCDAGTQTCSHVPDDDLCPDDGLFCNGAEICDQLTGCSGEGNPCTQSGLICDEAADECVTCQQDADCADGVDCTVDTCDQFAGTCANTPDHNACPDDGDFCNGSEICSETSGCTSSGDPCTAGGQVCDGANNRCVDCRDAGDCDDLVGCTVDSCNAGTGTCLHTPDDGNCPDDGDFCNGTEYCHMLDDCLSTGDPCAPLARLCDGVNQVCVLCGDGVASTTQGEDCDPAAPQGDNCCEPNSCTWTADGATDPQTVCAGAPECQVDVCNGSGGCAIAHDQDGIPCTQDPDFCNGDEECQSGACFSPGNPCTNPADCDEDLDICTGCGDGVVSGSEDCDPAAPQNDHCCDPSTCQWTSLGNPDPQATCSGAAECRLDVCDGAGNCTEVNAGDGTGCSPDGVGCTDDTCQGGVCDHSANDANCPDDMDFCNGNEYCDAASDCEHTGDPCTSGGQLCDGVNMRCVDCLGDGDCDDLVGCTDDSCNQAAGTCTSAANDANCPDDMDYCTGSEFCDAVNDCDHTGDPCIGGGQLCDGANSRCVDCLGDGDCSDPLGCTDDTCNQGAGTCEFTPNDANCPDDMDFCNGSEYCDAVNDCDHTGDPCTAGGQLCDGANSRCVDCLGDGDCSDPLGCTDDTCNQVSGLCEFPPNDLNCPDDGDFCNGAEYCDAVNDCDHAGDPCVAGGRLCDGAGMRCVDCLGDGDCADSFVCTDDSCDIAGGVCQFTPNDGNCSGLAVCVPECAIDGTGCVTPPDSLTVACDNPVLLPDDIADCTIALTGVASSGQENCLSCSAEVGIVTLVETDFEDDHNPGNCAPLIGSVVDGWTLMTGNDCYNVRTCQMDELGGRKCCEGVPCPIDNDALDGTIAFQADRDRCINGTGQWRLDRAVDTSGLSHIQLCFDYADRQAAGNNDSIQVEMTDGTDSIVLMCDADGPVQDVENQWYRYCFDMIQASEQWTWNNPDLQVRFFLHSENGNDRIYLDNITLRGWSGGCARDILTVLDHDFTNSSGDCDTTGWSLSGVFTDCPGFSCDSPAWLPGIEVEVANLVLTTTIDASDLDDEIVVCMRLGNDGAHDNNYVRLSYDAGSGPRLAWEQNGRLGPNKVCEQVCVNLSDFERSIGLDEMSNNPALDLIIELNSADNKLDLFGVTVTGAQFCPATDTELTLTDPTEGSPGSYGFTATDTFGSQLNAEVTCDWGSDPALEGKAEVNFLLESWSYRRQLLFDNSTQGETLLQFPVLVVLDAAWFDYGNTQIGGQDLRFYDADNVTPLAHEIEQWDPFGTSYVWVNVPQVDGASNTDFIWMYYGNRLVSDGQNSDGVWNPGYRAVYHLNEDFSDETTGGVHLDSTGNGNDGIQYNNQRSAIALAGGQYFDGFGDYIEIDPAGLQITGSEMTIEAWGRTQGNPHPAEPWDHIVGAGSDGRYWQLWWDHGWNGWHGRMRVSGDTSGIFTFDGDFDTWAYLVLRYDGSAVRLYLNTFEIGNNPVAGTLDAITSTIRIGGNANLVPRDFLGIIDEVRFSDVARSSDWIRAQYLSMTDQFILFGAEVTQ